MRTLILLLLTLALLGCEGLKASCEGIGEPCTAAEDCQEGQLCDSYLGPGGAAAGQVRTCEVGCVDDLDCPCNLTCQNVTDGPSHVCR